MQPKELKDYLDWTFYIDSKNKLINNEIFSIGICDPNINKVVLVYLKWVSIQGFQVWKDFVVAWNLILPHKVLQNQISRWPVVNYYLDFEHDSAKKDVNQNKNIL